MTSETLRTDPNATAKRLARQRCWWLGLAIILLVLLIAVAVFLPTLISTEAGTRLAMGVVNRRIAGTLDVERLKVTWLGPQRIEGLRVHDADHAPIVSAASIVAPQASLLSMLKGSLSMGVVTLTNFVANVERYDDGTTNVQRVLASGRTATDNEQQSSGSRPYSLSVEVVDSEVTYKDPDLTPIVATIPTAVMDMTDIRHIHVDLSGRVKQGEQVGELDVDASIRDLFDEHAVVHFDRAHITAKALLEDVPVATLDAMAGQEGLLVSLLGPRVNGSLEVNGNLSNLQTQLDVKSQNLIVQATIGGDERSVAIEARESSIELTVTPMAWTQLAKRYTVLTGTMLAAPVSLRINLKQLSVPLDAQGRPLLQQAAVSAELTLGDLLLNSADRFGALGLNETRLNMTAESFEKSVDLSGSSVVIQNEHRGRLGVNLFIDHFLDQSGQFNSKGVIGTTQVEFTDLPVALVEQFTPAARGLTELVGRTMNGRLEGRLKPEGVAGVSGPITLTARSQNVMAELHLTLRPDGTIAQQAGRTLAVDLSLTPAAFNRLLSQLTSMGPRQLELTEPSRIRFETRDMLLAWLPASQLPSSALPIDLNRSRLIATLTADTRPLRFRQVDALSSQFKEIRIKLNADKPVDVVLLDIQGKVAQHARGSSTDAEPALRFRGRVSNLVDAKGIVNPRSATISSTTQVTRFPVAPIDVIASADGRLLALLGQMATFTIEAQRSADATGSIKIVLESDSARVTAAGVVDPQGRLTLAEELKAFFKVTPEMGNAFLAVLNPLLADVQSAQRPIELTVHKEGFEVPLSDLRLANAKLSGSVDIGTLRMRQSGIAGSLVTGLRGTGSRVRDRPQFDAEFTTLQFQVADGIITSNDLWMDSGDLLLGAQARVSQIHNGRDLRADVLMAVPGETLHVVPKLTKRIRPEALYELHVRGPLDRLEPDFRAFLVPIIAEAALGEAGNSIVGQLLIGIGQSIENKPRGGNQRGPTWQNATWDNRPPLNRLRPGATEDEEKRELEPSGPDAVDLLGELLRQIQKQSK